MKNMTFEEWKEAVTILVSSLEGRSRLQAGENTKVFDLHNYGVQNKWLRAPIEHGRSCGACVTRTLGRLRKYVADNGN